MASVKYSVVIPTYNHCDDLLKPCLESVAKYSSPDVEVVVVANGCTDNTLTYLQELSSRDSRFRYLHYEQPLGYTAATNRGIESALGEYVVLLNNDTVLLEQPVNHWLHLLIEPFMRDLKVGITGPVKFHWEVAGTLRQAMAFWLVMIKREVFNRIGILDEIFSPGMGEDGDFCIRAVEAGYKLVSVPTDVSGDFNSGILNFGFPIYHVGNGTFADNRAEKEVIIQRNNKILEERYGKKVKTTIIIPCYNHLEDATKPCLEALLAYTDLSDKEVIVVPNGCTDGTRDFLNSLSGRVRYLWMDQPAGVVRAYNAGIDAARGQRIILLDNDSILQPQAVDEWVRILEKPFLEDPLVGASSPFANEYEDMGLVLHSGCTMYDAELLRQVGMFDEAYNPGYFSDSDVSMKIWRAGRKCVEVPRSQPDKPYVNNMFVIQFPVVHTGQVQTMNKHADIELVKRNRELLYSRYGKKKTKMKRYSIVIPTYNHCDDLLKPCVQSILDYSNLDDVELVIVANGCTDGTREYLEELLASAESGAIPATVKIVWSDEPLGYTRATNEGIKSTTGELIVLLNNDTLLLQQPKNRWLDMLSEPFNDPKVGITGPLMLHDDYADADVLIFFCVMIRRAAIERVGLLDEVYSPGGGEDIDFTIRLRQAGYKVVSLGSRYDSSSGTNVGGMPIWHKNNQTFKDIPEYTNHIVKRNGLLNCKKYNKHVKLNLGAGGVSYPGYLSVDLYDKRAHVQMDITKLDFDDNSVEEILASHVFEHLNPYHALAILRDWLRVLKPGGKLIMEMPDIEQLCKRFATASKGERYGILNAIYGSVNTTGEGGPDNITSPHLFGWWPESLWDHLSNAGYVDVQFMPEQIPHPESNLRVEAYKPGGVNRRSLKAQEPATYIEIFEHNSYRLEESEVQGRTVIDIGANLGMFTLRCLELGAKEIIAVEAQPTIYKLGLLKNVGGFSNVRALNAAAYDVDGARVNIVNHHVGSTVNVQGEGDEVETVTLRTLVNSVEGDDLVLKLDCEGSEFNVLMSSDDETLRRFEFIHLEVHGNCNPNPEWHDVEVVHRRLSSAGFKKVSSVPILWFDADGSSKEIGVYVEKWVRA